MGQADLGGKVIVTAGKPDFDVSSYVGSSAYSDDLAAVRLIWSLPAVLGTAGAFVFLTYLALPVLLGVRSRDGALARSVLDGERERRFLLRVLGLDEDPGWRGGIKNPRTQRVVTAMNDYHQRMPGMRQEYLDLIAAVITLSPLRVREGLAASPPEAERGRYWRYMSFAMSLFGVGLPHERAAHRLCDEFISAHAARSADGLRLMLSLRQHHPKYVELAVPALFDASRLVVCALLKEVP